MSPRSNLTDQRASIQRASQFAEEQAPSLERAANVSSARTVSPSTPDKKPATKEGGFLEDLGETISTGVRAALPPTITGAGQEGTPTQIEAQRQAGERTAETGVRAVGVGVPALPAGAERLLHAGFEELTGSEIPKRVEVGDVELETRPFQEIVAAGEASQEAAREFFGNDPNQIVDIAGDIVGGFATADQIFRSASFVNKFVTNRFAPALFRPLTQGQASAKAIARAGQAEQKIWAQFVGGSLRGGETVAAQAAQRGQLAERLARTALGGTEGGLFMAGLPDTEQEEILLGVMGGVALQGLAEGGGALLSRAAQTKASKAFPGRVEDIRRMARSGGDLELEGFPEFLGRLDNNLQIGAPYGQTSDEAVASIRAALSEQGETGVLGAVRGLTDLSEENLAALREAYPSYRFEVLGGQSVGRRFEIEEAAFRDAEGNVFRTGPVHSLDEINDPAVASRLADELGEGQAERGFVDNEGRFISSERAQRLTGADAPESSFIAGTEAGQPLRGDPVSDQKLVFGLRPGQSLPDGTREAPSLTDRVLEDFAETGFLRNQRVLVDGVEHRFLSANVEGERVLVKPLDRGEPFPVETRRVARLDTHAGLLKNDRLLQQFRNFRAAEGFEDFDRAFQTFADRFLEDMDDSLRPALRAYFADQEMKLIAQRIRPDEQAALQRFRSLRRELIEDGSLDTFEHFAAQRAHVIHRLSDGRVKLTNLLDGRTRGPFRNQARAREYLENLEFSQPDVAPSIEGVPDEMLDGMLVPHPRRNPAHPSKAELETQSVRERLRGKAEGFADWLAEHVSPTVTDMEASARIMERRGIIDEPLWEEFMRPLSRDLRIVQNRTRPKAERLAEIYRGVDEAEQDLIEGWLRSERKSTFEDAHDMPERLVAKAEETRVWLEDVFNEWTGATGTTLDPDAWMRNYAPDLMDWTSQTGKADVAEWWRSAHPDEQIPNEPRFFAEMYKSGEATELPQEPLASKLSRMLRSGMFKAHAGPNFDRATRAAREVFEDGSVAQRHLIQYLNGARGRIGFVQQRLDEAMGDLYQRLGFNPSGQDRRNLIDAMIDQTYGGTIAFRPALIARQAFQPVNLGGPILGNSRVIRAQFDALKPRHRDWARRVGILEERQAVTFFEELDEDVGAGSILRLNQRARNLGLKPYGSADKWNRVAVGLATRRKVEPELARLQAGEINETEFLERSGLWILDDPQRDAFFNILRGETVRGTVGETAAERATNFAADEVGSKLTNFLYGRRNAAPWLRTTPGRALGAYSTWPRGYLNWLTSVTTANVRTGVKLKALSKHFANNAAVVGAGASAGIGLGSWVAWNSLFFGGSPVLDAFQNAREVWAGMPWERERAAREMLNTSERLFLPGGQLIFGDTKTALERVNEDDPWKALGEVAGFRTFREGEEPEGLEGFRPLTPSPLQLPRERSTARDAVQIR